MTSPDTPRPLWLLMDDAYVNYATDASVFHYRLGYAAEIEALADWLVPEELVPPLEVVLAEDKSEQARGSAMWAQRQLIRQRLLAAAAEARQA